MRKITTFLALAALLTSNCVFAQTNNQLAGNCAPCAKKGQTTTVKKEVTQQPAPAPKEEFAWGIGLCGAIVVGVVAGFTAGMACQSN